MLLSHSYLTCCGSVDCKAYFYFVFDNFYQTQRDYIKNLRCHIEELGRAVGNEGYVVLPFSGDEDSTYREFLSKEWADSERIQFAKTPGLFVSQVSFDVFVPQEHQWMYFVLGGKLRNNNDLIEERGGFISELCALAERSDDLFADVRKIAKNHNVKSLIDSVELKPNFCGIGLDLKLFVPAFMRSVRS